MDCPWRNVFALRTRNERSLKYHNLECWKFIISILIQISSAIAQLRLFNDTSNISIKIVYVFWPNIERTRLNFTESVLITHKIANGSDLVREKNISFNNGAIQVYYRRRINIKYVCHMDALLAAPRLICANFGYCL